MKNYQAVFILIAILSARCGSDSSGKISDSIFDSTHSIGLDSVDYSSAVSGRDLLCDRISSSWKGTDKSVIGYYLNVPGAFLTDEEGYRLLDDSVDTESNRRKMINATESEGNYIRISSNPDLKVWEGWADIALFHDAMGDSIFVFFEYNCGPGCNITSVFLRYENGIWFNETDSVFTEFSEEEIRNRYSVVTNGKEPDVAAVLYELHPETGTIDVICDPQFVDGVHLILYTLQWKSGKFVLMM